MQKLVLKTESENADFYLSSLAIGILEGMKAGNVPFEVGIWSLARPVFYEELKKSDEISNKLLKWISSIDEFSTLQELNGNTKVAISDLLVHLKDHQANALRNNPSLKITSKMESGS